MVSPSLADDLMKLDIQQNNELTAGIKNIQTISFDSTNFLGSKTGSLKLRYGQMNSMRFGRDGVLPDNISNAWALKYQTDQKYGIQLGLNWQDVNKDFIRGGPLGFSNGDIGLQQRDYRLGWQSKEAFGLFYDHSEAKGQGNSSIHRDIYQAQSKGLMFQSDVLHISSGSDISSDLNTKLLGPEGYSLSSRKLGDSRSGLVSLIPLSGLTDRYMGGSFSQKDIKLTMWDRSLSLNGHGMRDKNLQASWKGLSLSQSHRQMDSGYSAFALTGYNHWAYLLGGNEDKTTISLNGKIGILGYTHTNLYQNPTGAIGSGILTQRQDMLARIDMFKNLKILLTHASSFSGNEKLFKNDPDHQRTKNKEDYIEVHYDLKPQSIGYTSRSMISETGDSHVATHAWSANYQTGKRTKIAFNSTDVTSTNGSAPSVKSLNQALMISTDNGIDILHETRSSSGLPFGSHEQINYSHAFNKRFDGSATYSNWKHFSSPTTVLAGYGGMLSSAPISAASYAVAFNLRPGNAQISTWYRSLDWSIGTETIGFSAGDHLLTDTGVSYSQAIPGDFGLRAHWNRFEKDRSINQERLEIALGYSPKISGFIPTAEIGYRQLYNNGKNTPSVFIAADIKPYNGLDLKASVAHRTQENSTLASLQQWRPIDRESLSFTASQSLDKDGKAMISWSVLPLEEARILDGSVIAMAHDLSIEIVTPKNWLTDFQIKAKYHTNDRASFGNTLASSLLDHSVGLIWNHNQDMAFSGSYNITSTHINNTIDQNTRWDIRYQQKIGLGNLILNGSIIDSSIMINEQAERYKLGISYNTNF